VQTEHDEHSLSGADIAGRTVDLFQANDACIMATALQLR